MQIMHTLYSVVHVILADRDRFLSLIQIISGSHELTDQLSSVHVYLFLCWSLAKSMGTELCFSERETRMSLENSQVMLKLFPTE